MSLFGFSEQSEAANQPKRNYSVKAEATPSPVSTEPRKAVVAWATDPEPGRVVIGFGVGDHNAERWELSPSAAVRRRAARPIHVVTIKSVLIFVYPREQTTVAPSIWSDAHVQLFTEIAA
jgi:hypothetical protein